MKTRRVYPSDLEWKERARRSRDAFRAQGLRWDGKPYAVRAEKPPKTPKPRRPVNLQCGTVRAYNEGCRCSECRAAKIAWNTAWRHRRNPPKPKVPRLSKRDHARLYRQMLRDGQWEQGVHRRRVTVLVKYERKAA